MDNETIAQRLLQHARTIEATEPNQYRVRAYRQGAAAIMQLERSVRDILADGGQQALEELPGIGPHLAYTIDELVCTGEFKTWPQEQAVPDKPLTAGV